MIFILFFSIRFGKDNLHNMTRILYYKNRQWRVSTRGDVFLPTLWIDYETPFLLDLVLSWHFKNSIFERDKEFMKQGGKFIFPLPEIEIV